MQRVPVREVEQETSVLELAARMDTVLHALCQPLTVLQCRLAMGDLLGEPDAMREAIREGMQEFARINETVEVMRALLQQVMAETDDERIR